MPGIFVNEPTAGATPQSSFTYTTTVNHDDADVLSGDGRFVFDAEAGDVVQVYRLVTEVWDGSEMVMFIDPAMDMLGFPVVTFNGVSADPQTSAASGNALMVDGANTAFRFSVASAVHVLFIDRNDAVDGPPYDAILTPGTTGQAILTFVVSRQTA